MRRTVITATDGEYPPMLLVEREELTESGWTRRSLAVADAVLPPYQPLNDDGMVLLRFLNRRFLIEEHRDAER